MANFTPVTRALVAHLPPSSHTRGSAGQDHIPTISGSAFQDHIPAVSGPADIASPDRRGLKRSVLIISAPLMSDSEAWLSAGARFAIAV